MVSQQLVQSFDRLLKWILKVSWLNALIIGFSLLGLVVGGVFPAIIASLAVAKGWINKEEFSTWKVFKKIYFQEFFKVNLLGWILTLFALILYVNYLVMLQLGDQLSIFVVFAYYFLIFVYFTVVMWIFPLYVELKTGVWSLIKHAFIMGVSYLPRTLGIFLVVFCILYVSLSVPAMLLFFTGSLIALSVTFTVHHVLQKIPAKGLRTSE